MRTIFNFYIFVFLNLSLSLYNYMTFTYLHTKSTDYHQYLHAVHHILNISNSSLIIVRLWG